MNNNLSKKLRLPLAAAIACSVFSVQARQALEEVIVTAQKSEQSLSDVGASIAAISGEDLDFRDLSNALQISESVPNLQYGNIAGASQITIRGIGLSVETGFAEPAVAVHIDGVYLGRANAAALGLSDLAGVEVLRGPQGTLYGRNATGGVLNFITNKPTEEFEAGVTLGTGSFDARKAHAYVSGPLSDSLRGRLFVEYKDDDGAIRNETLNQDEGGVEAGTAKADLSWDISDELTADVSYMSVNQNWHGPQFEKVVPGNFALLGAGFDPRPHHILNNRDPRSEIDMEIGSLTLGWDTDDYSLRSITGYTKFERTDDFDGDHTALDVLGSGRDEDADSWSQEFNLSGKLADKADWIVGAFYLKEESFAKTDVPTGVVGGPLFGALFGLPTISSLAVNTLEEEIDALGLFVDVTINVSDTMRLKAGVRYSEEDKTGNQTVINFDGLATVCSGQVSDISFDAVTPKAGVEWDLSDDVMTYAVYQEGFKSGGFNQSGCDSFAPEEIESMEVGVKGHFFDNSVYFGLSAFSYDYTNLQVLQVRNNFGFVENAADSTIFGLEFESKYFLTDNLIGEIALSWLDATYDNFIDGTGADHSGNTLSRSPEYTVFGAGEYRLPLNGGDLGDVRLRGEVYYSDDVFFRPGNADTDRQESYSTVNFYVAATSADESYQVSMFVKNATDEEYLQTVISLTDGLDGHFGLPRTWGVEFSAKWQ